MVLRQIEGFEPLKTHHCVTGSMRHIYHFHGHPASEELLLGLGAGVGFVYWHMKDTLPFYGGRANVGRPGEDGLEKTAGRRTGVAVESFATSSARKAEDALIALLSAGEPVMLQVDMGFLSYLELPEGYHFGGHVVAAAGYDPGTRQVLIADRDRNLHPVSLEELATARGSQFKPFPPRNLWYTFDFSGARPTTREEVIQAIREATTWMLEPPIANLGVKGIRTAAERTLQWPKALTEEQIRATCANMFFFIDAAGGTGGGIFRYMYGRFLREAAGIAMDSRLAEVGEQFNSIGDRWQEVAGILQRAATEPSPIALLSQVSSHMLAIAGQEQASWEELRGIVGR
jgi:hypothetical protein